MIPLADKVSSVLFSKSYRMPVPRVSAIDSILHWQESGSKGVLSLATNAHLHYVCYVHIEQYINVNSI